MSKYRARHKFYLLASTSALAIALALAPVPIDLDQGQIVFKPAYAGEGTSCFIAGTLVLMADGSEKPIERVVPGDLVMAPGGGANRVSAIETPLLGERLLYAFNGGSPFVTAEHPFMTRGGWKAIDPEATALENSTLAVGRLSTGDGLAVARAGGSPVTDGGLALAVLAEPGIDYVVLVGLRAVPADPATLVFNLLLDGDHAYFANGYLVHNKGGSGGGSGGGEGGGEGGDDDDDDDDDDDGREKADEGGDDEDDGESGEDEDSGESGEDEDSGESGESGEDSSGESGEDSGGEGGGGHGFGDLGQDGANLSESEESAAIGNGWQ